MPTSGSKDTHSPIARLPLERASFDRTRDHWWWRRGWGPGSRYATWHLTFEGSHELNDVARHAGDILRSVPSVDVVPPEWLHVTMAGVGFADDVDVEVLTSLAASVFGRVQEIPAEPVVFDRVFLHEEGVCLSTDSPWLHHMRDALIDCGRAFGGSLPERGETFHPHVSLAYFSGAIEESEFIRALDDAHLRPVTVPNCRLSLIELGRDDRVYTWQVIAQQTLSPRPAHA